MTRRIKAWQVDLQDLLSPDARGDMGGTTGGGRERDSERVILLAYDFHPRWADDIEVSQRERELAWAQWLSLAEENTDAEEQRLDGLHPEERRGPRTR